MCRLLGVVSSSPDTIVHLLEEDLPSFTALSEEHADGWGVAYRTVDGLGTRRSVEPAYQSSAYHQTVGAIRTDLALLHLRLANPGSRLTESNTHPFVLGATAFAHNGHFSPPDALDGLIDPDLLALAAGDTDSERYFLLVLQELRGGEDPVSALQKASRAVRERTTFSGLNCLLLTPDTLYAHSDNDPESEVSRRRGPDFFRLSYRNTPNRVVVASSGWRQPQAQWTGLGSGTVLQIDRTGLRVRVHEPGAIPNRVP
ncbi:class II glutamine amidotransferase [Micromonospora sp. NPDC005174]|uniref:class II glutamine amidotransferase n=1 Tax=unclassified Micromonospora TaxID=2617518 RepID=UPI0033AAA050